MATRQPFWYYVSVNSSLSYTMATRTESWLAITLLHYQFTESWLAITCRTATKYLMPRRLPWRTSHSCLRWKNKEQKQREMVMVNRMNCFEICEDETSDCYNTPAFAARYSEYDILKKGACTSAQHQELEHRFHELGQPLDLIHNHQSWKQNKI